MRDANYSQFWGRSRLMVRFVENSGEASIAVAVDLMVLLFHLKVAQKSWFKPQSAGTMSGYPATMRQRACQGTVHGTG